MSTSAKPPAPKVVFMGMRGRFSRIALARLIAAGIDVRAVVVPAAPSDAPSAPPARALMPAPNPSELPLATRFLTPDTVHTAWEHDIPVWEVTRLTEPEVLAMVASYEPDVICVACFNQRFPTALLTLPTYGCLNLHPSLLPAYRGPMPLFWIFRNGERATGVTVHRMDQGLDTGDILCQERIPIPEGIPGHEMERRCASLGGRLLAEAVRALHKGKARPRPQPIEGSSYYPSPTAEDFRIDPTRPARWAFCFIRGVACLGGPLEIHVAGQRFPVQQAIAYTAAGTLDTPFIRNGADLWVQCNPGVLHVRLRGTPVPS